jgi:hypothetical protein
MAKDFIKIHDQFSFELKLEFLASEEKKKKGKFNFDLFLFLPHSLDVNKHNFMREDFYRSIKMNIRLSSPLYKLQDLLNGKESPLAQLSESITNFIKNPIALNLKLAKEEQKRYCSIFGTALRYTSDRINRAKKPEELSKLIISYIEQIKQLRIKFHKLFSSLSSQENMENLSQEYRFADEYQSLLIETQIFALIKHLRMKKTDHKADIAHLLQSVEKEMHYRDIHDYPSVSKPNRTNEDVLHRKSRLKKYIESNLFLNTQTKREGIVAEQILFSIAAGLAMVFATAVAFASQMLYGSLTIPFFIALVIGYMFKDRIKELVRVYLDKKRKNIHADFKTIIYDQNEKKIGYLKERFHFEQKHHLPTEVVHAREMIRSTEMGEAGTFDNIIAYKNSTVLFNSNIQKDKYSGVIQILRFNISDFTKKMDDPEKEVLVRTKKGIKRMLADRVYHINLILRFQNSDTFEIKRYKIKASRNGIKTIERYKVSDFKNHDYFDKSNTL